GRIGHSLPGFVSSTLLVIRATATVCVERETECAGAHHLDPGGSGGLFSFSLFCKRYPLHFRRRRKPLLAPPLELSLDDVLPDLARIFLGDFQRSPVGRVG